MTTRISLKIFFNLRVGSIVHPEGFERKASEFRHNPAQKCNRQDLDKNSFESKNQNCIGTMMIAMNRIRVVTHSPHSFLPNSIPNLLW
jgi:hypothetical protein